MYFKDCMTGLKKKEQGLVDQNVIPIFILNIFLTLPKICLQGLKSFKNKINLLLFFFFIWTPNFNFYEKNNSLLFLIYLSMKSLIPISYCNLYYLIVVNCGLNLVILVSEKSYPDTRTEREPGAQPNLSFSGKTFLI